MAGGTFALVNTLKELGWVRPGSPGTTEIVLAVLHSTGLAVAFVAGFYIFETQRRHVLSRDHPRVVWQRAAAVMLVTAATLPYWHWVAHWVAPAGSAALPLSELARRVLGWQWRGVTNEILRPAAVVIALYAGTIVTMAAAGDLPRPWRCRVNAHFVRAYVVGPVAEEAVFRAALVPLWLCLGFGVQTSVTAAPLFFGFAHVHHAWELYNRAPQSGPYRMSVKQIAAITAFQLAYTTAFGWYAAWLFCKTGSVVPSIVTHSLCNYFGLPLVGPAFYSRQPFRKSLLLAAHAAGVYLCVILIPTLN